MNERIFELAKQAELIQWDTLPSGARTPDHESVVKAKKFAELIVRECVNQVSDLMDYCWYDDPENLRVELRALREARQAIKEHFGVK